MHHEYSVLPWMSPSRFKVFFYFIGCTYKNDIPDNNIICLMKDQFESPRASPNPTLRY